MVTNSLDCPDGQDVLGAGPDSCGDTAPDSSRCRLPRTAPDARREHILAIAAGIFARAGYGATSMATIAAALGGSKATLYKYFPSKDLLFAAVLHARCSEFVAPLQATALTEGAGPTELLQAFGMRFLATMMLPESLELWRMVHAEAHAFPEIAAIFHAAGPQRVAEALASALARLAAEGRIGGIEPGLAAAQFLGAVKGMVRERVALGLEPPPDEAEQARQVAHAVQIFVHGLTR